MKVLVFKDDRGWLYFMQEDNKSSKGGLTYIGTAVIAITSEGGWPEPSHPRS